MKYYEDKRYLNELNSRLEFSNFSDYFNEKFQDYGLEFSDIDTRSHYDIFYCSDIKYSVIARYLRDKLHKEYLENTRVFKFLINKYGLTPDIMLQAYNGYIEIYDNYFSIDINKRLWQLKEFLELETDNLIEELKPRINKLIKDFYNQDYFTGSDSDYKEFLDNLEFELA